MNIIKITDEKLKELSMLADWQLQEAGYCPESITIAYFKLKEENHAKNSKARTEQETRNGLA